MHQYTAKKSKASTATLTNLKLMTETENNNSIEMTKHIYRAITGQDENRNVLDDSEMIVGRINFLRFVKKIAMVKVHSIRTFALALENN